MNTPKFFNVETLEEALAACSFEPFCVEEVDGGFMCFESEDDFNTWQNQK